MLKAIVTILLAAVCASASAQTITPNGLSPDGSSLGVKVPGRFYGPPITALPAGSPLASANTLYAMPFFIGSTSVLKNLSFNITSGNASAWNARVCVYYDNSGMPGSLVPGTDPGNIAIASGSVTGVQTSNLSSPVSLYGPAWYWVAFNADSASESLSSSSNTSSGIMTSTLMGAATPGTIFNLIDDSAVKATQTFGACPASFGAATINNAAHAPYVVMGF